MFLRSIFIVSLVSFFSSTSVFAATCSEIVSRKSSQIAVADEPSPIALDSQNTTPIIKRLIHRLRFGRDPRLQYYNDRLSAVQSSIESILNEAIEQSFLESHQHLLYLIDPIRNNAPLTVEELKSRRAEILSVSEQIMSDSGFIDKWRENFAIEIDSLKGKWMNLWPVELFDEEEWSGIYETIRFPTPMFYNLALEFAPSYFQTYIARIDERLGYSRGNIHLAVPLAWIGSLAAGLHVAETNLLLGATFAVAGVTIPLSVFVYNLVHIFNLEKNRAQVQISEQAVYSVLRNPSEELSEYQLAIELYENTRFKLVYQRMDELQKELEAPGSLSTSINYLGRINRLMSGAILSSALFTQHPFYNLNRITLERLKLAKAFGYSVSDLSDHDVAAIKDELDLMNEHVLFLKKLLWLFEKIVDLDVVSQMSDVIDQRELRLFKVVNLELVSSLGYQIDLLESSYTAAADSFRRSDSIEGLIDASEAFRTEFLRTDGTLIELKSE